MTRYPSAPILCTTCRAGLGATIIGAGMIRDDELPPRCALCGFRLDAAGERVEGERPLTTERPRS